MLRMKATHIFFGLLFIASTYIFIQFFRFHKATVSPSVSHDQLRQRLDELTALLQLQVDASDLLLQQLLEEKQAILQDRNEGPVPMTTKVGVATEKISNAIPLTVAPPVGHGATKLQPTLRSVGVPSVLPILVMACDRVTVRQSIDDLLRFRPSAERFPIIVSQDCAHAETEQAILSYGSALKLIKQPDLNDIVLSPKDAKFKGYYKIARHYKWALDQVLMTMAYEAVIIVEDDLNISPDFFDYFAAAYPLLKADPTLWCISAWNDNGKSDLIDSENAELLHRTDFFPGLGWLLESDKWLTLTNRWPLGFWDDWMRLPEQRQGRACIRPEVSRTKTFGKVGVSKGEFFDKHLRFIQLNQKPAKFSSIDLSYLTKDQYDSVFVKRVYGAAVVSVGQLMDGEPNSLQREVRVQYSSADSFKTIAKQLGIMDDFKAGVPRTAYRGVVSVLYRGVRVYVAPPPDWRLYDESWN